MNKIIISCFALMILSSCSNEEKSNQQKVLETQPVTNEVKLAKDIRWEMLNPARGKKSPLAGTIWGNRKGAEPTGFLVKFIDGFSSPPHIHNVSYRGIVIKGLVHNDDSSAQAMWMPKGSYWTQPKGQQHITAAKGEENIAYIEIENSPYLVKPVSEAFESSEKPINVDITNLVWLSEQNLSNLKGAAKISYLWETHTKDSLYGTLLKLPKGYNGTIYSEGSIFRGVVITEELQYQIPNDSIQYQLKPGSSFTSKGIASHIINSSAESLIYIRTNGNYKVFSN
ncbi:MAG: DUF4437 domain-containing protein [Flavobacteriales bacterium]|nr:DUF4437 domain-containing protein [Flavobacteriales bacterium]